MRLQLLGIPSRTNLDGIYVIQLPFHFLNFEEWIYSLKTQSKYLTLLKK